MKENHYKMIVATSSERIRVDKILKNAGILEKGFDLERYKKLVPMQPGDVPTTYADITEMELELGYRPKVDLRTGIRRFACWYKDFYM